MQIVVITLRRGPAPEFDNQKYYTHLSSGTQSWGRNSFSRRRDARIFSGVVVKERLVRRGRLYGLGELVGPVADPSPPKQPPGRRKIASLRVQVNLGPVDR